MSATTPLQHSFTPVDFLVRGSRRFGASTLPIDAYARVRIDPLCGQAIADAYLAAPSVEPSALRSYALFSRETVRQYHFLIGRVEFGGLGLTVRIVDHDPYSTAEAMVDDVQRGRLLVLSSAATANPHPFLSDGENDMFRAVHDAFGHAASGRGFDPDGEEAAWLKHCTMYSPLARRALTTETRGQNCAQTFAYAGSRFPDQKAALLPARYSDPGSVLLDLRC